jgi:uncharacterized membrane protein YhiD involved in acid resistance
MNFFGNIFINGMTVATYLLSSVFALISGAVVAMASSYKSRTSKSFFATLIILPFAVHTVILMVNGNIGAGIAVAGAFSLIRFRSVPAKAREIISLFVAMAAGLACASGYIGISLIFTAIACVAMILLASINMRSDREQELRITIPEDINFTGVFDDLFEKYTTRATLISVKSANMGSLYKLTYRIEMKNDNEMRDFIDDIRVRNGNLEIALFRIDVNSEEL